MKKLTALCLVLVAVLAIGSVGLAAQLVAPDEQKGDAHFLKIGVVGEVKPYASMYFLEGPNALGWNGSKGATDQKDAFFVVKSNTPVTMAVEFRALQQENYRIQTNVKIYRGDLVNGAWEFPSHRLRLEATAGVDGGLARHAYGFRLQGVEEKQYKMTVTGTLGDIHHQAAGDYRTNILLTIAGIPPGFAQ